jgi:hypothetical protein
VGGRVACEREDKKISDDEASEEAGLNSEEPGLNSEIVALEEPDFDDKRGDRRRRSLGEDNLHALCHAAHRGDV